jgi:hypothetical protein
MIMPDRPGENVTRVSLYRKFCLKASNPPAGLNIRFLPTTAWANRIFGSFVATWKSSLANAPLPANRVVFIGAPQLATVALAPWQFAFLVAGLTQPVRNKATSFPPPFPLDTIRAGCRLPPISHLSLTSSFEKR